MLASTSYSSTSALSHKSFEYDCPIYTFNPPAGSPTSGKSTRARPNYHTRPEYAFKRAAGLSSHPSASSSSSSSCTSHSNSSCSSSSTTTPPKSRASSNTTASSASASARERYIPAWERGGRGGYVLNERRGYASLLGHGEEDEEDDDEMPMLSSSDTDAYLSSRPNYELSHCHQPQHPLALRQTRSRSPVHRDRDRDLCHLPIYYSYADSPSSPRASSEYERPYEDASPLQRARLLDDDGSEEENDVSFACLSDDEPIPAMMMTMAGTAAGVKRSTRCLSPDASAAGRRRRRRRVHYTGGAFRLDGAGAPSLAVAANTTSSAAVENEKVLDMDFYQQQPQEEQGEDCEMMSEKPLADINLNSMDADSAPTCTQALRKQWQTVSLSWRLRVFRAKRKVRNALHK